MRTLWHGGPTPRKDDGMNSSTKKPSRRALHKDTERLAKFLGSKDKPFAVELIPTLSTRRRGVSTVNNECDLFDEHLTVSYTVKPFRKWKALRRYKKFTSMCFVSTVSIAATKTIPSPSRNDINRRVCSGKARLLQSRKAELLLESKSTRSSSAGYLSRISSSGMAKPAGRPTDGSPAPA